MAITALPARAGVFTSIDTAGAPPANLSLVSRCYYLGTSSLGDAYTGTPVAIGSMDDFTNLFGSSTALNLNTIEAYLSNTTQGLCFVKVKPTPVATVTASTIAAGNYELVINGEVITVVIPANPAPTAQSVVTAIVNAINNNVAVNQTVEAEFLLSGSGVPTFSPADFRIRSKTGAVFTLTKNGTNLTVTTVAAPGTLNYWDWLTALDQLKNSERESPLGFITISEAYYTVTSQHERSIIGNRHEQTARTLGWYALIDPGNPTLIDHPTKAKVDAAALVAPQGHSAYYYPYLVDDDQDDVAPAPMVAQFALQRYARSGIGEPPAGSTFPFKGINRTRFTMNDAQLDDMAQSRINVMILKSGIGVVPFDCLTRSVDPNFKFINTVVVMNCLERSINRAIDVSGLLFRKIGSRGVFFTQLRAVIEAVCGAFYDAGDFYGTVPEDAYAILSLAQAQDPDSLEAGIVVADIYAVPAVTARQVKATIFRVKIGGIPAVLLTQG